MRWYQGGIADAVQVSKNKKGIFVVYIEGKDDKSVALTSVINSEEISSKLESENFVAIKIEADTLPHQQFTQIYKQAVVPSVFFIGKSGTPLEIINEPVEASQFIQTINTALEKHGIKGLENSSETSSNVICENGVCQRVTPMEASTSAAEVEGSVSRVLTAEEKVEHAKELVEKRREAKQQEEEQKERLKEMERRKVGQDVQKLKKWQEEEQLKNFMAEREREKREQQAARDRVLAQIEQDKADRAARFGSNVTPHPEASPAPERRVLSNPDVARLQFKLPDGTAHTHNFPSGESLQTVHAYIRANLNVPFNNYVLSTAFPRREFTDNNNAETLADLGLAPNAVVLILPVNQGVVSSTRGRGLADLFWTLLAPILSVFDYVRNFVFGRSNQGHTTRDGGSKRPAENPEPPRTGPKRRSGESTVVRRQGNVYRLSDRTDSDDDSNNTWNGNSTQQM